MSTSAVFPLTVAAARRAWLRAQRLDSRAPFGDGPDAVRAAVAHLGYVQIDTINVVERSHHHILFSRIPSYRREDLALAQSAEKSVFEYWTHALSYVATEDFPHFVAAMRRQKLVRERWFGSVTPADVRKVVGRIRREGPLSIRDIDDDVLVEKDHPWASRKPSKRALQFAFFTGELVISARTGMLKTYDLAARHFGWTSKPKPASEAATAAYVLDRALRAQGVVALESACYLDAGRKASVAAVIDRRVRRGELVAVRIGGAEKVKLWAAPDALLADPEVDPDLAHILSPFDPLIIQRKRLRMLFGHEHRFEAYVPKAKRVYGYFALPVLIGDRIAAVIDMKADRAGKQLRINQWTWCAGAGSRADKRSIDAELHRFERFQLGGVNAG